MFFYSLLTTQNLDQKIHHLYSLISDINILNTGWQYGSDFKSIYDSRRRHKFSPQHPHQVVYNH